jgi:cytoskeleton protein RodZ
MARGNFGERLKRERELREVTLEEITSATRIGPRFLEALENEEWEKLPGGVFNRGFVRSVARYLGLDEESFLAEYDLAHGPIVAPVQQHTANHFSSRPKWIPVVAFLAFLIVLGGVAAGGYYAWRYYQAHRSAKQAGATPASAPATESLPPNTVALAVLPAEASRANIDTNTSPPLEPLDLFVSVSAPTHLRILADGKLILDEELPVGANRHCPAEEQFEISAANSSAVLLKLNGQAIPPLGAPGTSGTITLTRKNLRPTTRGNPQP